MIAVTTEQVDRIIEQARGTCTSLESHVDDVVGVECDDALSELPTWALERIDEAIMVCQVCGWWEESSGLDEEGVCPDCQEGDDDGPVD